MYNDVLKLVSETPSTDSAGNTTYTTTEREVFCEVKSIGQSEFYQAQTQGLKPELKFVLADYYDYSNEEIVIYDGYQYKVLRTYRNGNELEITAYGGVRLVNA